MKFSKLLAMGNEFILVGIFTQTLSFEERESIEGELESRCKGVNLSLPTETPSGIKHGIAYVSANKGKCVEVNRSRSNSNQRKFPWR